MSLFSKKSKAVAKAPAEPKFPTRFDANNPLYPILGHRGHDDLRSVIDDFSEGTDNFYDFSFVCGPKLEEKKGKKKLKQGIENFGAKDAGEIYLVEDSTVFGSCKKGFLIADDGIYLVDQDGTADYYDWSRFDEAKLSHSDSELSIDSHQFITQQAQMLGSLLESLQDR